MYGYTHFSVEWQGSATGELRACRPKRLVKKLLEADLPYAASLRRGLSEGELTSLREDVALRCCKGLRATTTAWLLGKTVATST